MADTGTSSGQHRGILGWVERTGNRLPDPVLIFAYLVIALVVFSVFASLLRYGVTLGADILAAMDPGRKAGMGIGADGVITAKSLLSGENISTLLTQMPTTFTHFHPLGYVLTVMLGAGVAERAGLFGTAMRAGVRNAPKFLLTPAVAIVAMLGNHAADAAYVVLIPLAAILYAAAGRHPIAGIAAGFAGVSGGFSANLFPGQLDVLLFGLTEQAAQIIDPAWPVNFAGNWYFIALLMIIYVPVIWFVTDVIIEKRLGAWTGGAVAGGGSSDGSGEVADPNAPLTDAEKKGLAYAGLAVLAVIAVWVVLTIGPGTPLFDESKAELSAKLGPFFKSLVAGFLVLFLAAGVAYGMAAGTIKTHKDTVAMMSEAMKDMGYYLVLAFAAAHLVAMFGWSNLGLIFSVQGANAIEASGLPIPILMVLLVLLAGAINIFIGSASAKWALLGPVMIPMFMILGISPEATTAAYRVGDSATNIITPLMVYFPLVLTFAQRWVPSYGLGSLTATMLPYSLWMLITGIALTFVWFQFGFDLGPLAPVGYELPTAAAGSGG